MAMNICIVGAGIVGVIQALDLVLRNDDNIRVTLLEANAQAGKVTSNNHVGISSPFKVTGPSKEGSEDLEIKKLSDTQKPEGAFAREYRSTYNTPENLDAGISDSVEYRKMRLASHIKLLKMIEKLEKKGFVAPLNNTGVLHCFPPGQEKEFEEAIRASEKFVTEANEWLTDEGKEVISKHRPEHLAELNPDGDILIKEISWDEAIKIDSQVSRLPRKTKFMLNDPAINADIGKLTRFFADCFNQLGGKVIYAAKVVDVIVDNEIVTHLITENPDSSNIQVDAVIWATGASYTFGKETHPISKKGGHIPTMSFKGYTIDVEVPEQDFKIFNLEPGRKSLQNIALRNSPKNHVLTTTVVEHNGKLYYRAAGTSEPNQSNTDITTEGAKRNIGILEQALMEVMPQLRDSSAVDANYKFRQDLDIKKTGCERPYSAKGKPVLGQKGPKNSFLNEGHGFLGWTLSNQCASLVSTQVVSYLQGKGTNPIEGNSPEEYQKLEAEIQALGNG
jgi:glycine/D-amino acid oxidase-like deaminating enzyme